MPADAGRQLAGWIESRKAAPVLAALCIVQVAVAVTFALSTTHNHWLWYSGGDSTEYWTASWSLAHGAIPQAIVGYGLPALWAWVPLVTGTSLLSGMPVIVAVQIVTLVPLALVLFWAVADRLFGRLFAWWAVALWLATPFLLLAQFHSGYASDFANLFLAPHWYGLALMADLPSTVCVLAATFALLRLHERATPSDAALAGLLTGAALALKPANGFFLPAAAVLLLARPQLRLLAAWAGGVLPSLLTLAVWKHDGLGHLPIAAARGAREAAAAHGLVASSTTSYVTLDWGHLQRELADLGEVAWSLRLLELIVLAGSLAVVRRAPLKGMFVVVWFGSYFVVKGSSSLSEISSVSYWRYVEPGFPALVLLAASLVYLVPRAGRAFARPRPARRVPGGLRTLGGIAAVLAAAPLLLVLLAQPASAVRYARIDALANDAPLSESLRSTAAIRPGTVTLHWQRPATHGTSAYFGVYRSNDDDGCHLPEAGAHICELVMTPIATTRDTSYTERRQAGRWWYRIVLLANFRDREDGSDLILVGPPTEVR